MFEGHGDDLYRYAGKVRHNFSTNIVSGCDHTGLIARLSENMGIIGSYPEPHPYSLERKIASLVGVAAEEVVVTNGATDAIYRIARIFMGEISAINRPTFREYQDACREYSHTIRFFDTMEEIDSDAGIVWLCNPNNPTGKTWPKERLLELAARRRDRLIVIDQAYADYTLRPVVTPREGVEAGNVMLLNSLTKRFCIPGLRIGYVVAAPGICRGIRDAGIPWAVNSLAIKAGDYLLDRVDDYPIRAGQLHDEALRISKAFGEIGIPTSGTDCNFILCRLPEGRKASDLKEYLVDTRGILIRDASNFEGLDERFFRVAAQSAEENDDLIDGVAEWISGQK